MMKSRKIQKVQWNDPASRPGGGGIHPFDEMLSLLTGKARLNWMGTVYEATAPALFLLPANTPHTLTATTDYGEFGYIELELDKGESGDPFYMAHARQWNKGQSEENSVSSAQPEMAMIKLVHQQMWEQYPPRGVFGELAEELVIWDIGKLLTMIRVYLSRREEMEREQMQGHGRERGTSNQSPPWPADAKKRLLPVIRYMESSYQQLLLVRELADQANMELNHFIRSFRKVTGKPPLQYLLELRLHAACCYLRTTKMPIQEVAWASGFSDIHYFSKLFKRRYGQSPTGYRTEQLQE